MDFFLKFINEWRKARRINLGLFLFAFLALIFISYLGAFNNNFLSGANTQSFFYPSVAEACSSNDYNCLECQGVNCGTYCSGYTYYYDSYCSYGACYFNSYQNNSPSCGYVDPCAGVSCPQEQCVGYDMVYSSHCSNGSCVYDDYDHNTSYCCYGVTCNNYCSGFTYYYGGSCNPGGGSCSYANSSGNYPGCGYNICSGVVCSDACSGTTLYPGGSCNTSTGQCSGGTPVPNSPSCGYVDPCAGVTCNNYCSGTTLYHGGTCSGGTCSYATQNNSPSCGYNICGGVTCPDYCEVGGTYMRYYNGYCNTSNGKCVYSTENYSTTCGYDPCAGVTCDDYCGGDGYTRFSGGYCSGGNCYYTYAYHNSSQCGCTTFYYPDTDGDGYGDGSDPTTFKCYKPVGYVTNYSDCDDTNASHWQLLTGYTDADHDGYGTGNAQTICSGASLPVGYAANNTDCNDSNASVWQLIWGYNDADGDGYGVNPYHQICSGASLPSGYSTYGVDCNDSSASIYPGTTQTQSCTVTSTCSNTCTGSQTNICYADGTYTAWSACGGCTPATCDPCAGVTCDSPWCNGYEYVYGGYCSGGSCYYSYEENSSSCSYPGVPSTVSSVTTKETNGGGGLSTTWSSVGASGYRVYVKGGRTNPNNAVLISDTSGTSAPVTLAGQCPGSYTVTVVAYNNASVGVDQSCTNAFSDASLSGATVPSGMICSGVTVSTVNLKSCTGGFLLE